MNEYIYSIDTITSSLSELFLQLKKFDKFNNTLKLISHKMSLRWEEGNNQVIFMELYNLKLIMVLMPVCVYVWVLTLGGLLQM